MEIKEAAEVMKKFNEWRRGSEIEQPNPSTIGIAIDTILELLESSNVEKRKTYTSTEVCSILNVKSSDLSKLAKVKPGFKIAVNTWDSDLVDEEKRERDYRKSIVWKPIHGRDSFA